MHKLENLPNSIEKHIAGKAYTVDSIGRSGSLICLFEDCVLKIEPHSLQNESTVRVMQWLAGKLPVPQVIAFETEGEFNYLLMSRLRGDMACDPHWMQNHEEMIGLLADALKMLWRVEITDCPRVHSFDELLAEAEEQVNTNRVDLAGAEEGIFGENGFADPRALLDWLKANKPDFDPVLSHGDFCLPNVLFQNGSISGFLDLNHTAVSDRWQDIVMCLHSLRWNADGTFGGPQYPDVKPELLLKKLNIASDPVKLKWFTLLNALF